MGCLHSSHLQHLSSPAAVIDSLRTPALLKAYKAVVGRGRPCVRHLDVLVLGCRVNATAGVRPISLELVTPEACTRRHYVTCTQKHALTKRRPRERRRRKLHRCVLEGERCRRCRHRCRHRRFPLRLVSAPPASAYNARCALTILSE